MDTIVRGGAGVAGTRDASWRREPRPRRIAPGGFAAGPVEPLEIARIPDPPPVVTRGLSRALTWPGFHGQVARMRVKAADLKNNMSKVLAKRVRTPCRITAGKPCGYLAFLISISLVDMQRTATAEDVPRSLLHELLTSQRLQEAMDSEPNAFSGPYVRLSNGRRVTAAGLRKAVKPLIDKPETSIDILLEGLSDKDSMIRWAADVALQEITGENPAFYRNSEVSSESHARGVEQWKAIITARRRPFVDFVVETNLEKMREASDSTKHAGDEIVDLPSGKTVTHAFLQHAIQPFLEQKNPPLDQLLSALDHEERQVRYAANLALKVLTKSAQQPIFIHTDSPESERHKEGVEAWRKVVEAHQAIVEKTRSNNNYSGSQPR